MVQTLRQAGYVVPHLLVEATDPKRHAVLDYGAIAMGGCVLGRHDDEIARAIGTLVRRNAETNRRQQDEARAKSAPQTAADAIDAPAGTLVTCEPSLDQQRDNLETWSARCEFLPA